MLKSSLSATILFLLLACASRSPKELPQGYIFVERYGRASRSALDSTDKKRIEQSCQESARSNALKVYADAIVFECRSHEADYKSCYCKVAVKENAR
jgi:hypothetical protein